MTSARITSQDLRQLPRSSAGRYFTYRDFTILINLNTATSLSLIDESVLTDNMKPYIEQSTGVTLRCVSNTNEQPLSQIRIYLYLQHLDIFIPFYIGVPRNFPSKLLISTMFCERHIKSIKPNLEYITPKNSQLLPILTFNEDTVSSIH